MTVKTPSEKLDNKRLRVLGLADVPGNITLACKRMDGVNYEYWEEFNE